MPDTENKVLDEFFELSEELSFKLHNNKYIELLNNPIPEGLGQGRRGKKKKAKASTG